MLSNGLPGEGERWKLIRFEGKLGDQQEVSKFLPETLESQSRYNGHYEAIRMSDLALYVPV